MSKPKHLIFSMAKLLLTNTLEGDEVQILAVMQFTIIGLTRDSRRPSLDDIHLQTKSLIAKTTLNGLIQTCHNMFITE